MTCGRNFQSISKKFFDLTYIQSKWYFVWRKDYHLLLFLTICFRHKQLRMPKTVTMNKLVKYKFIVKTITVDALIRPGGGVGWGVKFVFFEMAFSGSCQTMPHLCSLFSDFSGKKVLVEMKTLNLASNVLVSFSKLSSESAKITSIVKTFHSTK